MLFIIELASAQIPSQHWTLYVCHPEVSYLIGRGPQHIISYQLNGANGLVSWLYHLTDFRMTRIDKVGTVRQYPS